MLFSISFERHVDFVGMLDACSKNNLDVTDSVILEKSAIVCYNIEAFLYIINTVLELRLEARVHFVNVD